MELLGEYRDESGRLFPAYGRQISWRKKTCEAGVGRVEFHWLAIDAVAVAIRNGDGSITNIFPEFGDTWRYWP